MKMPEVLDSARDAITVKRVFAEPVEKDGLTIIPVATVAGMVAVVYLLTRHKTAWVRARGRSRRAAR